MRELEGLRQRSDEFISSFVSHRQGKIAEIVDRPLQRGDLVLKVIRGLIRDPRGKFRPNWSGPYFIRELTPEGAAWMGGRHFALGSVSIRYRHHFGVHLFMFRRPISVRCSFASSLHISLSVHVSFVSLSNHIHVRHPQFSFVSITYHLGLRYVPCLKTTLRPWDQMSSSAASTWTGLIQLCSDYQDHLHDHYHLLDAHETRTWSYLTEPLSYFDAWIPSCLSIWEVILDICA
ncbi:hypothetical protein CK203_014296 [Vitis vinifera]|uniref:Uncharacterized protein n=1 Tax=Vitis vinifera TaxID=29760 RepID=A0A438JHY3_VITVI|nr:hypothetical protein CK203_014296 [Vitis vinifera]